MKNLGNNYKKIIEEAKKYPQLREEIKEVEEMSAKGYNIKNNIEDIKNILTKIINK